MTLDLSSLGFQTKPYVLEYDWKTVVLYALGIGATRRELDFVYEGRGPRVYPTFAVVAAYGPVTELFERTGCDMTRLVHGAQLLRLHRPIPAAARLETVGRVKGIYDMKKLAQVVLETRTTLGGEPCFDTEWQLLLLDAGGFGGERPPKTEIVRPPADRGPDFVLEMPSSPEQALLYRLSGDHNPLHADPEFAKVVGFEQGPILHGLCTFGYLARAVIQELCAGDEKKLRALAGQFRKPVWPGDSIRVQGHRVDGGRVVLEAFAGNRPDAVISNSWAELAP
ncbi:MAG TPA: MaoC/PaaZ C-terminal domain-containing protein [Polyangiaceae bacterium]|nr:MaoC/PaaZ C-terminal domain-containing protein [Polyangiaceae bacterium]